MRNNTRCCSYRIELEKSKQATWKLVIFARLLIFLVFLVSRYWR